MNDDELTGSLRRLLEPSGDPQYAAVRDAALGYLLRHADEAHPRLLGLLAGGSPPVVALAVLPIFGRPESIPVLENLLTSADDPTVVATCGALARHPSPEAAAVLERALHSDRDQVVASAADGLADRGDPGACPALKSALNRPNEAVRDRIREAVAKLGCPV